MTRDVAERREEFTLSDIQGDLFCMIADMADGACLTDVVSNATLQLDGCGSFPGRAHMHVARGLATFPHLVYDWQSLGCCLSPLSPSMILASCFS